MNVLTTQRQDRSSESATRGQLSWSRSSIGHSVSATGLFLRKQLWIWPIIAVLLLSIIGFSVRRAIETTMKDNLQSQLTTLLDVETEMVHKWLVLQTKQAETISNDALLRTTLYELLNSQTLSTPANHGKVSELQRALDQQIAVELIPRSFVGYFVAGRDKTILASSHRPLVGQKDLPMFDTIVDQALVGTTNISLPAASPFLLKDTGNRLRTGVPTMFVAAPIRDSNFSVVGVLGLQIRPEEEFTRTLQLGRIGESGETYAFDKTGLLISNSRFDDELILLGIVSDRLEARSIVELQVRDPGADMTRGFRPTVRRSELPLTRMAVDAISGNSGCDVNGYRDYRGVRVVGAWTWLADYGMGIATEIDYSEAFRPLTILRRTFWSLYTLLVLSAIAIFAFTVVVARLQREAQRAAIKARKLGQYTLEEKLGEGGMGVVYRGFHAMLRRPTAIKLLHVNRTNEAAIERFEHEVQITCQLANPNTIAIYDYGRTPEGVFYYAMEYLDGINLQLLVNQYGPQPEGRVIHILEQVCGSLFEAHSQGLVHRDIKPANIMLNRRGGQPDFVKVLDFGLVRVTTSDGKSAGIEGMVGTPLYISPEGVKSPTLVDACSDIYAVGAVGYFLLTGCPVFEASTLRELLEKHVSGSVVSPSHRLGKHVTPQLEHALLSCLEKSRAKRPQTARDLAELLRRCPTADQWSIEQADAWWLKHERNELSVDIEVGSSDADDDDLSSTTDFS